MKTLSPYFLQTKTPFYSMIIVFYSSTKSIDAKSAFRQLQTVCFPAKGTAVDVAALVWENTNQLQAITKSLFLLFTSAIPVQQYHGI
jgi:hypothetical protein